MSTNAPLSAATEQQSSGKASSNRGKWMALTAALLGWMFDGFEMGLFPLIGRPALADLLGPAASETVRTQWFGVIMAVFLVGAATGGVLFGWLGDRFGRVRAMALSIFCYAFFTGLCAFATDAWHIAALRFIASLGMGGEWSLGVALVNEIWPGKSRALVAGLIGAAANVGFLLIALISLGLASFVASIGSFMLNIGLPDPLVDKLLANSGWRLLMIIGAFPAVLVFFVRLFVPESEKWEQERARGATSHWANLDLFGVLIGCIAALIIIWSWSPVGPAQKWISVLITIVGLAVALMGYLYPVRKYLERALAAGSMKPGTDQSVMRKMILAAVLVGIILLGTWGSIQWAPRWAPDLKPASPEWAEMAKHSGQYTQIMYGLGAILAAFLAAIAAGRYGRRITYAVLCVAAFGATLMLYQGNTHFNGFYLFSVFLAGGITAAFYGWCPLYLPELFPTSVRATGQGFAYNFGRILAAVGGLQTATLTAWFGNSIPTACSVLSGIYLVGVVVIWFAPETKGKPLPE